MDEPAFQRNSGPEGQLDQSDKVPPCTRTATISPPDTRKWPQLAASTSQWKVSRKGQRRQLASPWGEASHFLSIPFCATNE